MVTRLRRYRYARKAVLFGDGAKGMRLQVYGVFACVGPDAWVPTGIAETLVKPSRGENWRTTVDLGGEVMPTLAAAIDAYEETLREVAYGG